MQGRKKVFVVSKSNEDPSSYYRLLQYLEKKENVRCVCQLSNRGYRNYYDRKENQFRKILLGIRADVRMITALLWDCFIYQSEILIVNRKIFPRYCPKIWTGLLKKYLNKKVVVWDFDDHILSTGEISRAEWDLYQVTADRVIVTNAYLKSLLCGRLQKRTILLPTTDRDFETIDLTFWNHVRKSIFQTNLNLLWLGTKGNLIFLDGIIKQLEETARHMPNKQVTVFVVCNAAYKRVCADLRIKNMKWTREQVLRIMPWMHVGLMPLEENVFTKGKGAFKAVQYIGAGLPVVASPVGYNCSVVQNGVNGFLTNKEWESCLRCLAESFEEWETYSLRARKYWEENFNSRKNLEYWMRLVDG